MQAGSILYTFILTKVGNGRHVDVRTWAENIANGMTSIKTYGRTLIIDYNSEV